MLETAIAELTAELKQIRLILASRPTVIKEPALDETPKESVAPKEPALDETPKEDVVPPEKSSEKQSKTRDQETLENIQEVIAEAEAEQKLGLPKGKRDANFFNTHLRQLLMDVAKNDPEKFNRIKEKYATEKGVSKISETPTECWDDLYMDIKGGT